MLKRALLKFNCIIKQSALKILSNEAKESRNIQGTVVNNVENSNQKNFKKKSLKIFSKPKNTEGALITKMVKTWVTGKFYPIYSIIVIVYCSIFYHGNLLGLEG